MSFEQLLIHTATIERPVASGSSPFRNTLSTIASSVPARLVPIDGSTQSTQIGRLSQGSHVIYFKGTQDVEQNDEITLAGISKQFRVVEDLPAYGRSTVRHHTEVLVEEHEVIS